MFRARHAGTIGPKSEDFDGGYVFVKNSKKWPLKRFFETTVPDMTMIVFFKVEEYKSSGFLIYKFSRRCLEHTCRGVVKLFLFDTVDVIMTDFKDFI